MCICMLQRGKTDKDLDVDVEGLTNGLNKALGSVRAKAYPPLLRCRNPDPYIWTSHNEIIEYDLNG